ncbi:hypothetical protein KAX75_08635 [candidate division WOR-3 bacterium]|nr:hypothetical protein [candidate division WOR-3 bacterium]
MKGDEKLLKKSISLFLSAILLLIPLIINAQETENEEIAKAIAQANADVESYLVIAEWKSCGCFDLGSFGNAYKNIPPPDPSRLIGKSLEYVEAYTKTYHEKIQSLQETNYIIGCIGAASIGVVLYFVIRKVTRFLDDCASDFKILP